MRSGKWLICLLLAALSIHAWAVLSDSSLYEVSSHSSASTSQEPVPADSLKPRYSVRKTAPEALDDMKKPPIDLHNPENIKTEVEYDEKSNLYLINTKAGTSQVDVPLFLTPEEYADWSMKKSIQEFYRAKNAEAFGKGKGEFNFMDMKFDLGPAEKIFGPGGVQLKTQGNSELTFGFKTKNVKNPSLPERSRKTTGFDFDEKINISVNGKVGDKVNMNMNYNTDATFDFDTKNIKLKYEGKEDEIIKLLEAGNVSMPTNSSLIKGATSLFGIRTDLQFGKLKLQTVISQQESESKTVNSKGGAQTTSFEISADNYDENRHFFLAHYFRDTYDKNMSQLPNITSGIKINRIEVWITNKRGNYDNPRNVVALTDLAENEHISNTFWSKSGVNKAPDNSDNDVYSRMVNDYSNARNIDMVSATLGVIPQIEGGMDYEKIESARLLSSSEYTLNSTLGYLSLKATLQPDEVLAVAYEYTYKGKGYQVGEFASDIKDTKSALYLKLLKNTSNSPASGCWDLMMKNVYSLNAYQLQSTKFRLDIKYQSDTTGVYLNYIPEGKINKVPLLRVMNLDRLDAKNQANPNGFFDFVEGYTVTAQNGRIFFPVVEPFGSHLRQAIGNNAIADKYVYQELYDSTKTVAKQIAEKDKFKFTGEYKASSGSEISLGSTNVPVGSVKVTAGGVTLVENSDYTVDYSMGIVTILNQSIIDAGTSVSVSLESNTSYNLQRKTMLGMNLTYDFSKDFQIGGTIMHLKEKPMTTKVAMGEEPISNTIWGVNTSWKKESQWLTNMVDKLPFVKATQPSRFSLTAEYAQLVPGQASGIQGNASYIDDFESTKTGIDLRQPSYWMLASTPYETGSNARFPEASKSNDISYGMNRALLAWYNIDGLFTRRNSSLTPSHIKSDLEQLSNHYVREVYEQEIFPNKETSYMETSTLSILNLAYYPNERGPYNLDPNLTSKGLLPNPEKRWGGIMRKLDTSDFETANIEYVEFWMLDPFIYESTTGNRRGGDLYINLGEVSEDILKDGKKYFENGMPIDGNQTKVEETVWGKVPKEQSIVYAFDTSTGARKKQDVGLNGITAEEERTFGAYSTYLNKLKTILDPAIYTQFEKSPAGDLYHYYRGSDYDQEEKSILERYKYYNNTEGNSTASEDSPEKYDISSKTVPDVEDINQDNTLNEYEKYFQYKINIAPEGLKVGSNYITNKRTASVKLRNGKTEEVNWYQFKIPVRNYDKAVGSISDFKSIRFMRMYLTNFVDPVVLRFATLDLVRGEWRNYEQALYNSQQPVPTVSGSLDVSAVNIEENSDKTPVNYVLPPGITRVIDPSQPQLKQENEQAMSLKVQNLSPGDARAVYKSSGLDLRQYKRLQMFIHGEKLLDDVTSLEDNEVSVFIRLGSDYKNNYYEYEIPLKLTPHGQYNGSTLSGCKAVWPENNMLDIPFELFTKLKKERNTAKNTSGSNVSFAKLYYTYDTDKPANKISIIGNPSLAEVKTVMIGVRNNSRSLKSAEVWVNELRLTEFNESGGWAAQGNMNVQLSDLGSINLGGHMETAGFGGLEQSVSERRLDDYYQYNFTTSFELGKFFPAKAKISAPIYYSYSKELTSPKYDPTNQDLLLSDVLDTYSRKAQKDSIRNIAQELVTYKNFSLSNMRMNITSKKPMPYDPSNFTIGYSFTKRYNQGNTTAWESDINWKTNLGYNYSPANKPWEPFKNLKNKSSWMKLVKAFNLSWLPQNISFNSDLSRHSYELQLRDLDNPYGDTAIPLSVAKEFLWNRDFSLRWDLTKNLHLNFTSATRAEIEEPYGTIDKNLYPDEYAARKDSIKRSLLHLGRPLDFQQTFNVSYKLPFDLIPILNWVSSDAKFTSSYTWDRGVDLTDGSSVGNTIANQRSIDLNGRFNFETLYNKVPFLKETNKLFASNSRVAPPDKKELLKNKKFEKEVQLKKDTTVTLSHGLKTKILKVSAITQNGKRYLVKYKVQDENKIIINNRDSIKIKLSILPGPKPEEQSWYKMAQSVTRFAMMARNFSVTYRNTFAMTLPGYLPEVGDLLGQKRSSGMFAPGLDFAFGVTNDSYIQKAARNNWLISNDSVVDPATTNAMEDLQIRMTLEPFKDFKIDLTANRTMNKSKSIQFMYEGMPTAQSGSFSLSIISLNSAFDKSNAGNAYASKTFDKFLQNLDIIQKRVEAQYVGAVYPEGTTLGGKLFDPANGTINKNSPDVMIPAFLAAYTGKSADKVSLDLFPNLLSLMPNWRITYGGLSKLEWFKKRFKSFNLNHAYKSTYAVGSYNTYQSFSSYMDNLGFVEDAQTGNPVPSAAFDIGTVSINEQFAPLFGVDMTFKNGITSKVEYKKTRILTLSMTANQIVESGSKDIVVGMGYKIVDLKLFGAGKSKNKVSNDLNLLADISFRNQSVLSRNIQENIAQPTSGNKATKLSISADYTFSKLLTIRMYYDRQQNTPLVSSASYPVTNSDFGFTLKFSLTR
ncbi:cell surface protein SprA [uncultured Bacteroides sp.]|uniref:T9SS outer membrane translocon Sov/SprA n=1 Tax=uncultured Bacteroides sp. TaxID=162156 RepID=UPI002AAB64AF|nr:cell surface protein SprA [uncultured Bacteroides sp.]